MQKILGELDPEQEKVRCLSCSALALALSPPPRHRRARTLTHPVPEEGRWGAPIFRVGTSRQEATVVRCSKSNI